ncbi:phage holin family protein [Pseudomonadota bacterium AL_CKDN230030165-1A_HGKHYDSX7]
MSPSRFSAALQARLARVTVLARFAAGRLGQYAELLHIEMAMYRQSLVRSLIALVALVLTGMGAAAFISIAVLVHYWDTPWRRTAGWAIAGVWFAIALISFLVVRRGVPDGLPFQSVGEQMRLDADALRDAMQSPATPVTAVRGPAPSEHPRRSQP